MISKVILSLEQNMYELHKYYMTLYEQLLVIYDTQNDIAIGDALSET
jgi:hypothetical protein